MKRKHVSPGWLGLPVDHRCLPAGRLGGREAQAKRCGAEELVTGEAVAMWWAANGDHTMAAAMDRSVGDEGLALRPEWDAGRHGDVEL